MKPVPLFARLIAASTPPAGMYPGREEMDNVLDLFAGSGTTLVACEQLGRTSFSMEIDESFTKTILKRFTHLTGEAPRLVED
jgi:site-specific DNA-methyltransferase (adenine-specific)